MEDRRLSTLSSIGLPIPAGSCLLYTSTPSHRYVLPGGSTWFSVKGADASYASADTPTDLSYTVNDELGTVSGQTFTAGSKAGRATITGSNGAVSGSMNVCITTGVDSIALQSGGKALSSISVSYTHLYPFRRDKQQTPPI